MQLTYTGIEERNENETLTEKSAQRKTRTKGKRIDRLLSDRYRCML